MRFFKLKLPQQNCTQTYLDCNKNRNERKVAKFLCSMPGKETSMGDVGKDLHNFKESVHKLYSNFEKGKYINSSTVSCVLCQEKQRRWVTLVRITH